MAGGEDGAPGDTAREDGAPGDTAPEDGAPGDTAREDGAPGGPEPKRGVSVGTIVAGVDAWQRRRRAPSIAYAVMKKFGDDDANLLVVALGWYGFTAIYPLLLVVVTILGFVGVASLGNSIVSTLHQFPVIGTEFSTAKGGSNLHGSVIGLVIGVAGLLYGAQGVTQIAAKAMGRVWNVPAGERPGFLPRLGRSIDGLVIIGGAFVVNALLGTLASGAGGGLEVVIWAVMLVINVGFYVASFRVLTPGSVPTRPLVPGAITASVFFTLLITAGTSLVDHQLRHQSATYGAFASVIGTVAFLLILAKLTIYAAELNPVMARSLFPRSIAGDPIAADLEVVELRAAEIRPKEQATEEPELGAGAPSPERQTTRRPSVG